MKNILLFCFAIFTFIACKKEKDCSNLSPCLEAFKSSEEAKTIRTQTVDGETHYWLNTDARTYDGLEYILNESCDTVCSIGGFRLPLPCESDYDFEDWEIIWEK
jgi:hypothetical protein